MEFGRIIGTGPNNSRYPINKVPGIDNLIIEMVDSLSVVVFGFLTKDVEERSGPWRDRA
jgi:hypothetical protein